MRVQVVLKNGSGVKPLFKTRGTKMRQVPSLGETYLVHGEGEYTVMGVRWTPDALVDAVVILK